MTEQNTTTEALSATGTDETPEGGTPGTPDPENGSEAPKGNREARFRQERNEAREALSQAEVRIAAMQTREVERLAAEHLAQPGDLFTLSGKALADLLDDDGNVDPEAVAEAAADVLASRPGLRPNVRYVDHSQGSGNDRPRRAELSFNDLFKS
jgi:hypothetical protein